MWRSDIAQTWFTLEIDIMPRTVLILGMHRSGTSCLTGSLQEAGLQLGEVNQKTRCNEKGTRENVAIMELNDAVLESAGASWDNPPREDIVWRKDHKVWRKQVIKAAVQEPAWGFKDPRTLLTLDGWLEALPNAQFIGTFRDPIAVAKSLHVRNGFPLDRGLALWRAYNERLLALCDARDVAVINFDWAPMRYQRGLEVLSEKNRAWRRRKAGSNSSKRVCAEMSPPRIWNCRRP